MKKNISALQEYPSIAKLVQTEKEMAYLEGITEQHFLKAGSSEANKAGSCIYADSCSDAMYALELIADKLGKDDSKERELLLQKGTPASSLVNFAKYYVVEGIKGKMRMVAAQNLDPNTVVKIECSPKKTPSIVISEKDVPVDFLKDVNFATVIVGGAPDRDGEKIWTIFAGHPTPMIPFKRDENGKQVFDEQERLCMPDELGLHYGQQLTVKEAMEKLGPDLFISIKN